MLKRLKELTVQAANDTYTDEERKYMQMEIDQIKTEIDRISIATDFNGIRLLDGSLGGLGRNNRGLPYGVQANGFSVWSNIVGVEVNFKTNASGLGGEFAMWSADGKTLTINVSGGAGYTQSQIDALVKNASIPNNATNAPADIAITLRHGIIVGGIFSSGVTAPPGSGGNL
jgi:flagellin